MRYQTEAGKCSKQVKKELQKLFPNIKFSVKSENYSMGDSVNVYAYLENIEDLIAEDDIKQHTNKYEYGKFDGMTDYYEVDNRREDIPQTKYLFVNVEYSPEITKKIVEDFNKYWNGQFTATTTESESYYFKDKKVGHYQSENTDTYYWINQYIKEHIKK